MTLQHSWKQHNVQFVGSCWGDNILVENDIHFSLRNISIIKCWLDLVDSMLASQWMNFVHLQVMSFGGCGIGIMTIFQLYYNQCNVGTCHVIEEKYGISWFWLLFNYIITNGTLTCVTWAFVVHHQTKLLDVCHVDTYVTHLQWHMAFCCL